jgi:probable phosphoglycerate mutase
VTETRLLYLIRHGQTAWNLEKRLQGGSDSPLTERGRRQAGIIARSLGKAPPVQLLASPLGRAGKTAAIIAGGYDIPVETDARLAELRCGEAEGLSMDDIDARWPDLRARRDQDKWHVPWPGGECYRDVDERLKSLVNETLKPLLGKADAGPIGIVAHETMNMILLGRLLDLDPSLVMRLGQPNHVIYRLTGQAIEHAFLGEDDLEWMQGAVQKRGDDVLLLDVA